MKCVFDTISCKWCGAETINTETRECNNCWELYGRIEDNQELTKRMLDSIIKEKKESLHDKYTIRVIGLSNPAIRVYFPSILDCQSWASNLNHNFPSFKSENPIFEITATYGALTYLNGFYEGKNIKWIELRITPDDPRLCPPRLCPPQWGIYES